MRTILRSIDFKELITVRDFPEGYIPEEGLLERNFKTEYKGMYGEVNEIMFNGIHIEQRSVYLPRPLVVQVDHDFPFLKMHFELAGHSAYMKRKPGSIDVEITGGCHHLFFFPEVKGTLNYPAINRNTLEIHVSVEFFKRIFDYDLSSLQQFGVSIESNTPSSVGPANLPITPEMKGVIQSIINCPLKGPLKKIFLEAKVMELLSLQLDHFINSRNNIRKTSIKKSDRDKFYFIKETIENNISNPYSLEELARISGMSISKVKKGFKEMFGQTVSDYLINARMECAKSLILERDKSISEIAYEVGYKNPQHFTAAFKREMGYLPSELLLRP